MKPHHRIAPLYLSVLLSACASWNPFVAEQAPPPAQAEPAPSTPPPARSVPQYFDAPGHAALNRTLGYSSAVRAGDWILVSGQVGMDPASGAVPPDFEQQVRLAFGNLRAALREAGASLSDVVELQTYQLDMRKFGTVARVRQDLFGSHRPVWTAVGVRALADPQLHFEVRARAYLPKD